MKLIHASRLKRNWKISLVAVLTFLGLVFGMQELRAQESGAPESNDFAPVDDQGDPSGRVGTSHMGPAEMEEMRWSSEVPSISAEKKAQLESWTERTGLPGPVMDKANSREAPPDPSTESTLDSPGPQATALPRDARVFRKVNFEDIIPDRFKSSVMEGSVGVGGKQIFYTGNWFAARSTNGGKDWTYVNPFKNFEDFCCDQVTLYDESRHLFFWLRMGVPGENPKTGTYENIFKLGVSSDGGATFAQRTVKPADVNPQWANLWWDYPHMQLGADYLYLAWNLFDRNDLWKRTVMLRLPLNKLAGTQGFDYEFYENSTWFTFVPVHGANHVMYWASNWPMTTPQNSRIALWRWPENFRSPRLFVKNIDSWSLTSRTSSVCGGENNNWLARSDFRIRSGARYSMQGKGVTERGRTVLGWWWNVKQGNGFPQPYVEAAAFYEDTLEQVTGDQGRPNLWSASACLAYPSAAANDRGDLGLVLSHSTGPDHNPGVVYSIADDLARTPPGWWLHDVQEGGARPCDRVWGDYNTARPFYPSGNVWVGASHYLESNQGKCRDVSSPLYFVFGRERDRESWLRWRDR